MKILFLLSQLKKQGPNTQFLYLLELLNNKSVEVEVLTYKDYKKDESLEILYKKYGIKVTNFNYGKLSFIKYFMKTASSYDYVCSYGFESDLYNAFFHNSKRISFVRNQLFYSYANVYGLFRGYILAAFNYVFLKRMHIVFACSKSVQKYIKKFNLSSIHLTNSINKKVFEDLVNFKFSKNKKIQIAENFNFEEKSKNIFLTIASELKGKNTQFLLECFSLDVLKDYKLYVLGKVDKKLRYKYDSKKNIIFLGFQPDIYSYYKKVDFFVSASLHEGLPNAVLEALYFKLPCLLSDIPEHLEILEESKHDTVGYCFKNNNIDSFIRNVQKITTLDLLSCGKVAHQMIDKSFNTENTAIKFLDKISQNGTK